jgi:hypothetical protein
MAPFGDGSFIPSSLANHEAYTSNVTFDSPNSGTCPQQAPFMGLLHDEFGIEDAWNPITTCVSYDNQGNDSVIAEYLFAFYYNAW